MRIEIGILQYFLTLLLPVCKHVIGEKVLPTLPKEIDILTLSHDLYCIKIFLLI